MSAALFMTRFHCIMYNHLGLYTSTGIYNTQWNLPSSVGLGLDGILFCVIGWFTGSWWNCREISGLLPYWASSVGLFIAFCFSKFIVLLYSVFAAFFFLYFIIIPYFLFSFILYCNHFYNLIVCECMFCDYEWLNKT